MPHRLRFHITLTVAATLIALSAPGRGGTLAAASAQERADQPRSESSKERVQATGDERSPRAREKSRNKDAAADGRRESSVPRAARRDRSDEEASFAERERVALAFAREHHRQLADLLERMKRRESRGEYAKAVDDLYETSERLSRLERDQERHALMLEIWKLDSRARLLAARMSMTPSPQHEEELEEILRARVDRQLELYRLERNRASARVERLDKSIQEILEDPEAAAQKSLERVKRSIRAPAGQRPEVKSPEQPPVAKRRSKSSESRTEPAVGAP